MISSAIGSSSYVSQLVSTLYSKLDTNKQGYFQLGDLQSALGTASDDSSGDAVEALFSQLDGDSDGKVTQSELSTGLQQLANSLNSSYDRMRMEGYSGATPPPPPPGGGAMNGMPPPPNEEGFTQDELQSQLDALGDTDSERSSLIASVIENFDSADANGDGKVNFQEATAFSQANTSTASATTGDSATSSTSDTSAASANSDSVMSMIMQLLRAYGQDGTNAGEPYSFSANA